MHYTFEQSFDHFINISLEFPCKEDEFVDLQLPVWRPGRYELGMFTQNIGAFKVYSGDKELEYEKINHSQWRVTTIEIESLRVEYQYYANQLDAGSSYSDDEQLYVNPINCCLYVKGRENDVVSYSVLVNASWMVRSSAVKEGSIYKVGSFHEMVDTPFFAAQKLIEYSFWEGNIHFHLVFHGECDPNFVRIEEDFRKMIQVQLNAMKEFPCKEYYFLYQIAPYRLYHGVEHLKSTVIALGPGYDLMSEKGYSNFLEISSHELFHAWNVKSIRPELIYTYDYSKENYYKEGYLTEGVTTYFGDHFLVQSEIYSLDKYLPLLESNIQRHIDNFGRFNKSLAMSSFDLWVDGYKKGIPNRKVSIYSDGAIMALIADLEIIEATNASFSLLDVMKLLYQTFAKNGVGVSESDYKWALEKVSSSDFTSYFELIHHAVDYCERIQKALHHVGMYVSYSPSPLFCESKLGIRVDDKTGTIVSILPNSSGANAGLFHGDVICSVNGFFVDSDCVKRLEQFKGSEILLGIKRKGRCMDVKLKEKNNTGFNKVKLKFVDNLSDNQKNNLQKWISKSTL